MSFEPGDVIEDKYRIVRTIGAGGMGAVYEGVNVRIGRRVAIKVMHGEASKVPDLRRRFAREARVAAKIGSANICDVLDLGDLPDGSSYLVMEYLVGESLDDRMNARKRMPAAEIALLALQLLDGLSAMHGAGIVHRDLKPANIFITSPSLRSTGEGREVVKILDFGISKFQTQLEGDEAQTATGTLMGTPLYMSPEQSRGVGDLDGRSDLYCVGVILYRALAGEHCFEAANIPQLLYKTAVEPPIPLLPRVDAADQSFVPIVEKAMAKAPGERFQTAREFRDAIEAWLLAEHPMELLPPAAAHFDGLLLGGSGSYPNIVGMTPPSATPAATDAPSVATPLSLGPGAAAGSTGSAWEKKVSGDVSALAASLSPAESSAATIASPGSQAELATAPPSVHTPAPSQPPPESPKRGARLAVAGVAAALAVALVAVGVQRTTASGATAPSPPPSAASPVPSAASKPSEAPPPLASAAPSATPPATGAPSAEASAAPTTARPPAAAHATATKPAASTPVAATPPPAAPSASAKPGRKIRTEL